MALMGLFSKKPSTDETKPKRHYRKPTDDEIDRKLARREQQEAHEKFLKLTKDNPELEREWVSKKMGIEIKPPDPSELKKKEIHAKLVEEAYNQINKDPELRRQYAEKVLGEIVGEVSEPEDRRYGYGIGSEGGYGPLEALELADELKERFGNGGKSWADVFKDPDVVTGFLEFLGGLTGRGGGQLPQQPRPQRMYIVRINGEDKTITEAQYQQMMQAGQLKPVAELEPPKPKQDNEQPSIEVTTGQSEDYHTTSMPPEEPELPEFLQNVDINAIMEWMDTEPEEFVNELKQRVSEEVDEAKFLWGFLSNVTYDSIVTFITPYQGHSQIGDAVERVLSEDGKAWLEAVIERIQEKNRKLI